MEHSSMKVAGNDEDSLSVECLGWKPAYMGFLWWQKGTDKCGVQLFKKCDREGEENQGERLVLGSLFVIIRDS